MILWRDGGGARCPGMERFRSGDLKYRHRWYRAFYTLCQDVESYPLTAWYCESCERCKFPMNRASEDVRAAIDDLPANHRVYFFPTSRGNIVRSDHFCVLMIL